MSIRSQRFLKDCALGEGHADPLAAVLSLIGILPLIMILPLPRAAMRHAPG